MNSRTQPRSTSDVAASESLIRSALTRLQSSTDHVFELRALDVPGYSSSITASGWFDDLDAMAREAVKLDLRGAQVYVTLNPVQPALLCRANNRVIERPKATTADRDILRRVWIPIDIDPVRPSGVSSSDDELAVAKDRATKVAEFLTDKLGEPPAIWACSGNGYHLLFRTELANDDKNTAHVKALIDQSSEKFSDDAVSIDRTVFNAARIWRLYGTMNRKGDNVSKLQRVHRRAAILGEGFSE